MLPFDEIARGGRTRLFTGQDRRTRRFGSRYGALRVAPHPIDAPYRAAERHRGFAARGSAYSLCVDNSRLVSVRVIPSMRRMRLIT